MKNIFHHKELDKVKWDAFVSEQHASIFSVSTYLDATAQDWSVYFDEENKIGFVLPFVEKLGVKGMYPPFFHRYIEIIGTEKLPKKLIEFILAEFKFGFIHSRQQLTLPGEGQRVHQNLTDFENLTQSSQFKRSVKRAIKNEYKIQKSEDVNACFDLIIANLSSKLDFYKSSEVERLKVLVNGLFTNGQLFTYVLTKSDKIEGALFAMKHGGTYTYLKGSCSDDVTKNGGMYLLMDTLIQECKAQNVQLDFGGSQVEGVRNFNHRLGGSDKTYYTYHWDNSPFWFKTLKKIRKWLKK